MTKVIPTKQYNEFRKSLEWAFKTKDEAKIKLIMESFWLVAQADFFLKTK